MGTCLERSSIERRLHFIMRNVDKMNFCGNAIFKQEVKNFIGQSYSIVLLSFKLVDVFPEMSRKFQFSFLTHEN